MDGARAAAAVMRSSRAAGEWPKARKTTRQQNQKAGVEIRDKAQSLFSFSEIVAGWLLKCGELLPG